MPIEEEKKILLKDTTLIRWNKVEQNGTKLQGRYMDNNLLWFLLPTKNGACAMNLVLWN